MTQQVVVDTSIIVRWFIDQCGTDRSLDLLDEHLEGKVAIATPWLSVAEAIAVIEHRHGGAERARLALKAILESELDIVHLDAALIEDGLLECVALDCRLYDGIPAALARRLSAPLWTAERRAHSSYERVVLVA